MKRITALAMAVLLLLAGCQQAQLLPQEPQRFQMNASAYQLQADLQEETTLAALAELFAQAQPAKVQVPQERLATLQITAGETVLPASLFQWEEGYYIEREDKVYTLDAAALFALLPEDSYRSHTLPEASLGEETLLPAFGTYAYRRLEGWQEGETGTGGNAPLFDQHSEEPLLLPVVNREGYRSAALTVTAEGAKVYAGDPEEAAHLPLKPDTLYMVEYTALYDEDNFRGSFTWQYSLQTEEGPQPVDFSVEPAEEEGVDLGEVLLLRVSNLPEGERPGMAGSFGYTPSFFSDGQGGKMALLPVSYYLEAGTHNVQLFAAGESRNFAVAVRDREFEVQHLTVDAATTAATIGSQEASAEFTRAVNAIYPVADEEKYWQGRFILPSGEAPVTTSFGAIRYTNGSTRATRHEAIDYDLEEGTRVGASGAGRVIYAGYLQMTGNTVVIEHGWGLKTWYYHMVSLEVETGEMVKQAQKIGEVGTTGFSTGPHLHFGMSVGSVFINPLTAIESDFLNW